MRTRRSSHLTGSPLTRIASLTLAVVGIFAVAVACSGDSDADAGAAAPTGEVVEVIALDNTFRPERLEISPGTTVRWVNRGRNDHDVEPTDGGDWGVALADFAPGDEYEHTFAEAGEYDYICTVHAVGDQGMVGTIVVTDG